MKHLLHHANCSSHMTDSSCWRSSHVSADAFAASGRLAAVNICWSKTGCLNGVAYTGWCCRSLAFRRCPAEWLPSFAECVMSSRLPFVGSCSAWLLTKVMRCINSVSHSHWTEGPTCEQAARRTLIISWRHSAETHRRGRTACALLVILSVVLELSSSS